ncbi:unnamed protein product [Malus baccata var. baccata]
MFLFSLGRFIEVAYGNPLINKSPFTLGLRMIELDQIGRTKPIWPPYCFNPYLVRILKLEFTPSTCPSLISLPTKPMDPQHGCRPWRPCLLHHPHHHLHHLHHHHHRHPLFLCPLHHHLHRRHDNHHFHHLRPNFASFPQNPEPPAAAAIPFPTHMNSEPSEFKEAHYDDPTSLTLPEQTHGEIGDGVLEEEEDDEPIFVLTDEWKEFFAKSEAKRKLGTLFSVSLFSTLSLHLRKIIVLVRGDHFPCISRTLTCII